MVRLPSVFEPTAINNDILIDGGVVNNYPINEVKAMGADIIIGVDVQDALVKRDNLASAADILLQISNYRTVKDMVQKSRQTELLIKPDITNFSVIDFDKTDAIIEEGKKAALYHLEELEYIHRQQNEPFLVKKPQEITDSIQINRLIIQGLERYTRGYIKGLIRFNLDDKITFKRLQQGLGNIAATDNFNAIRYKITSNGSGSGSDLTLKLKEKPNKLFLKVGAHYDDLFKSAALMNLTRKKLLVPDDVASLDLILGDHLRYNFDYHIDKGKYWSFGINSSFADFDENIQFSLIQGNFPVENPPNINEINLDFSDWTNQIYFQTVLKEEFALRLGVEHKLLKFSTRTLAQFEEEQDLGLQFSEGRSFFENSNYYSAFSRLTLDTYDDAYFPSKGLFFDGRFNVFIVFRF